MNIVKHIIVLITKFYYRMYTLKDTDAVLCTFKWKSRTSLGNVYKEVNYCGWLLKYQFFIIIRASETF